MNVLGVIPARGGSKRVKDKNIRLLGNQPLIAYTLNAANGSELLSDFVVSTDSLQIKETCESLGYDVPFLRPENLSGDKIGDLPVIKHALEFMEDLTKKTYDAVVYLRPTSPFKTAQMIDNLINLLEDDNCDSVRSMTKAEGIHHPYWMYWKNNKGVAEAFDSANNTNKYYQSQLLPDIYHLNGVVDGMKTKVIRKGNNLYGEKMKILELPQEESFDIDTEFDLKICECLLANNSI
jgi:CMP-N-acetylneuraminic acid synthetase